jgi:hypothetical protein
VTPHGRRWGGALAGRTEGGRQLPGASRGVQATGGTAMPHGQHEHVRIGVWGLTGGPATVLGGGVKHV